MFNVFTNFLQDLLESALNALLDPVQSYIGNLFTLSLRIEKVNELWSVSNPITAAAMDSAYTFVYGAMCGIMALAFLYKGWKVYVLWRDGDSDVAPQSLLIGAAGAIVMALAFPYLYDILCDVILYIGNGVIDRFQMEIALSLDMLLPDNSILLGILLLIYIILMLVVFCKLLSRGVELLFLRLGFPLACLGLINSDSGIFKQYAGIFFKQAALSIIQMTCLLLGLFTVVDVQLINVILAVVFEMCALSAPKLMAQLLPNTGGGRGGMSAIYALSILTRLH